MKDFWNSRYKSERYAYGTEPNRFFAEELHRLGPGNGRNLLLPAEGEGRNAVHAALQGYQVTAFDISEEGRQKALKLAKSRITSIDYQCGSLDEMEFPPERFDLIALVYAHFPPGLRQGYHQRLLPLLKPGGTLLLKGFAKGQLHMQRQNPGAGGPKNIDMLFSQDELAADFAELNCRQLTEETVILQE